MLGRALHRLLIGSKYHVRGLGFSRTEVQPPPSRNRPLYTVLLQKVNLLNYEETSTFLDEYQPDVIVHCAAERFPDAFEKNLDASFELNVDATRHLANECLRLGDEYEQNSRKRPFLIYISTSYVFDGGVSSKVYPPYKPDSKTNPINSYGQSKWEGECAIRDILNNDKVKGQGIIVRVPLLYGEDCSDLNESPALEMMKVHLPHNEETLEMKQIDDWALRFPTSVEDVAKVLMLMMDELFKDDGKLHAGTYHVSSPHGCTKFNLLKIQSKLLNIPDEEVNKRAVGNSIGPPLNSAPRPQCTQLDCSDTWNTIGKSFEFVTLEEGMTRALDGFPERFM
jgi:S-adenosylmethionine synthetase